MATRDYIAPLEYYARFVWLLGFVILLFSVMILNVQDRTIQFLFYLSLPFFVVWWIKAPELEPTPLGRLLPQIGIGFLFGLGGLWVLFFFMPVLLQWLAQLWWIPPTMGVAPAQDAWLQLAVGIVEEGNFRVALPRLFASRRGIGVSIILSNWIFGMFHWVAYQGNLVAIMIAVGVGILQSLAYFLSRNPLGPMLGHAVWNLYMAGLLVGMFWYMAWGVFLIGAGYYVHLRLRRHE